MASDDHLTPRHADVGNVSKSEPQLREIKRIREFNRQMHVQRSLEAGLSREEAERHADEEAAHWSPKHIEERSGASANE